MDTTDIGNNADKKILFIFFTQINFAAKKILSLHHHPTSPELPPIEYTPEVNDPVTYDLWMATPGISNPLTS